MKLNTRDCQELKFRENEDGEGIIEGYFAVWNTIDSYNSTFKRGCFTKTLSERAHKVKILFNHQKNEVIGVPIEILEDEHGAFISLRLLTDIQKANEVFILAKNGAIDAFSFGFRTIKNHFEKGVEIITEVMLGEISPVVFEANETALFTAVRNKEMSKRETNFFETFKDTELSERMHKLMDALWYTIWDIDWELPLEQRKDAFEKAIDDFKTAFMSWADEYATANEERSFDNDLSKRMDKYITENGGVDALAKSTSLTVEQIRTLRAGKHIAVQTSLDCLPDEIQTENSKERSKAVEALCDEIRGGLLPLENERMIKLLGGSLQAKRNEAEEMSKYLTKFRETLTNK